MSEPLPTEFPASYRTKQERMYSAILAEKKIRKGEIPDLQSLKDLVEAMGFLKKRIHWWNRVGSKRRRPWSRRRELIIKAQGES